MSQPRRADLAGGLGAGTAGVVGLVGPVGLVEGNLALVGHLVREVLVKVPTRVTRDDLTSTGMMALVVSAQAFDADQGVPFARFAAIRIRRALLDELRSMDWAAPPASAPARELASVRAQLTEALGRAPRSPDLAAALGMTVAELQSLEMDVDRDAMVSLNTFAPGVELLAGPGSDPEELLLQSEKLGYLRSGIAELPDRLRYIVTTYFFQQRQMREIALELGISESRLRQLRADALRMLRENINAHVGAAAPVAQTPNSRAAATRYTNGRAVVTGSAARVLGASLLV